MKIPFKGIDFFFETLDILLKSNANPIQFLKNLGGNTNSWERRDETIKMTLVLKFLY